MKLVRITDSRSTWRVWSEETMDEDEIEDYLKVSMANAFQYSRSLRVEIFNLIDCYDKVITEDEWDTKSDDWFKEF